MSQLNASSESIASSDERLGSCVGELNAAIIEAREKQVGTADQVRAFADSVGERATLFNELMGRYAALGNAARDVGEKMQPASTSDKAELELALVHVSERDRIEQWRHEALERAGYDPEAAIVLAASHDIDLHDAVSLLDRGCTVELALQILL